MKSGARARAKGLSMRRSGVWRIGLFALAAGLIAALSLALYFFVVIPKQAENGGSNPKMSKQKIMEAWSAGERSVSLELSRAALEQEPFDPFYLSMNGIAAYYVAADSPEGDERQSMIEEALFSLRKALASRNNLPVKAQVEYVLGKTYFQKGSPWLDLAIRYLELSIEDGYESKDSEQYLALSYAGTGDHAAALRHFETALAKEESDILKLSAAISYKELKDNDKASALLFSVLASASDALLVQRARFMLGEMAMDKGNLPEAQGLYKAIVDTDPGSAEGWYRLGMVAEALMDPIAARASWRKATSIDPNHVEARKKLAERL